MILIIMGVCGAGKSTIAQAVAARLGWPVLEADDFHPQANIEKMAAGSPLTDIDREPWLSAMNTAAREMAGRGHSAVMTCSALKRSYRDKLRRGLENSKLVYLYADPESLANRLQNRPGHFMKSAMLSSQLTTLEPPDVSEAVTIDTTGLDVDQTVGLVLRQV